MESLMRDAVSDRVAVVVPRETATIIVWLRRGNGTIGQPSASKYITSNHPHAYPPPSSSFQLVCDLLNSKHHQRWQGVGGASVMMSLVDERGDPPSVLQAWWGADTSQRGAFQTRANLTNMCYCCFSSSMPIPMCFHTSRNAAMGFLFPTCIALVLLVGRCRLHGPL